MAPSCGRAKSVGADLALDVLSGVARHRGWAHSGSPQVRGLVPWCRRGRRHSRYHGELLAGRSNRRLHLGARGTRRALGRLGSRPCFSAPIAPPSLCHCATTNTRGWDQPQKNGEHRTRNRLPGSWTESASYLNSWYWPQSPARDTEAILAMLPSKRAGGVAVAQRTCPAHRQGRIGCDRDRPGCCNRQGRRGSAPGSAP